jgi:hypothetical protein
MLSATFRILVFAALLGLPFTIFGQGQATTQVPITGGSIALDRHQGSGMSGQASIVLNDLTVTGPMVNFAVTPDCNHVGSVCLRGSAVHLPQSHYTEDGFGTGSVITSGQTIEHVYFLGGFNFQSIAPTIPRMSSILGVTIVTAPFTATGQLLGCSSPMPSSQCSPVDTIFNRSFSGGGTVTYRLRAIKGSDFTGQTAQYSFDLVSVTLQFAN